MKRTPSYSATTPARDCYDSNRRDELSLLRPGGGCAFIFADQDAGRVIKLFKTRGIPREFIKTTCWSEEKAYNLVQRSATLTQMVPGFYGRRSVTRVIGPDEGDLTGQFYLDLAYEIDLVPAADFKKWLETPEDIRAQLAALFSEVGIKHYSDACVTTTPTVKAIDFAADFPEF